MWCSGFLFVVSLNSCIEHEIGIERDAGYIHFFSRRDDKVLSISYNMARRYVAGLFRPTPEGA